MSSHGFGGAGSVYSHLRNVPYMYMYVYADDYTCNTKLLIAVLSWSRGRDNRHTHDTILQSGSDWIDLRAAFAAQIFEQSKNHWNASGAVHDSRIQGEKGLRDVAYITG